MVAERLLRSGWLQFSSFLVWWCCSASLPLCGDWRPTSRTTSPRSGFSSLLDWWSTSSLATWRWTSFDVAFYLWWPWGIMSQPGTEIPVALKRSPRLLVGTNGHWKRTKENLQHQEYGKSWVVRRRVWFATWILVTSTMSTASRSWSTSFVSHHSRSCRCRIPSAGWNGGRNLEEVPKRPYPSLLSERKICLWSYNKPLRGQGPRGRYPNDPLVLALHDLNEIPPRLLLVLRMQPQGFLKMLLTKLALWMWRRPTSLVSSRTSSGVTDFWRQQSFLEQNANMFWRWLEMAPILSWSREPWGRCSARRIPLRASHVGNAMFGGPMMSGPRRSLLHMWMMMARPTLTSGPTTTMMDHGMMVGLAMRPTGTVMQNGMRRMELHRLILPMMIPQPWRTSRTSFAVSSRRHLPYLKKPTKPWLKQRLLLRRSGLQEVTMPLNLQVEKECLQALWKVVARASSVENQIIIRQSAQIVSPALRLPEKEKDMVVKAKERAMVASLLVRKAKARKENSRARARAKVVTTSLTASSATIPTTTSSTSRRSMCMSCPLRTRRWVGMPLKRHWWILERPRMLLELHQCRDCWTRSSSSTRWWWVTGRRFGLEMDYVWEQPQGLIWQLQPLALWRSTCWMALVNRPHYFLELETYMIVGLTWTMRPSSWLGGMIWIGIGAVHCSVSTVDILQWSSRGNQFGIGGWNLHQWRIKIEMKMMMTLVMVKETMMMIVHPGREW